MLFSGYIIAGQALVMRNKSSATNNRPSSSYAVIIQRLIWPVRYAVYSSSVGNSKSSRCDGQYISVANGRYDVTHHRSIKWLVDFICSNSLPANTRSWWFVHFYQPITNLVYLLLYLTYKVIFSYIKSC